MYLKSLEITGFKSFAERTRLEFSPGITAVVGPNGCGKSNLLDAVRWALGEQSVKLLRGGRMEDLIFNGTANRKALNFAEVTLIFDRADQCLPLDYQEVAVTRRLYRSGEGEYYLNKTPCRLKDIFELFLDTGIGTETYSLIGQGRVEQLINARPEEHRELFAEAAGIHKYKQRKKEAGRNLEEMKGNLLRIADLLAELQSQSSFLAEAAARAKEYQSRSTKLENLEKKIFGQRWGEKTHLLQKINAERQKIDSLFVEKKSRLAELSRQVKTLEEQENSLSQQMEENNALWQTKKGTHTRLQGRLSLIQGQKKNIEEKISWQEISCKEVEERGAGLEGTLQKNKEELESIQAEQEQLGEKAALFKAALQELQGGQDLAELKILRERQSEKKLQKVALQQFLKNSSLRSQEFQVSLERLTEREKEKRSSLEALQRAEKELTAVLERIKWDQQAQDREYKLLGQRSAELRRQREEQQVHYQQLENEWQKKSARLKYLQEGEDYFSLYSRGVRAIMQAAAQNALQGIYGPIANLLSVPPTLEKAIEVALGAKLQFIIVADDSSAREAIEFLKANKAGKATFLPLNLLKVGGKKIPGSPLPREFLGVASQLVEVAPQFRKAVDYLLGYILIARDLETALKLARNNREGWRIVTLDGEMITPGGAISGGYQPVERSGFLERKRELKDLAKEVAASKIQIEQKSGELQALAGKMETLANSLAEAGRQQRALAEKEIKSRGDFQRITAEISRMAGECTELAQEKKERAEQYRRLKVEETAKEKEHAALKESLAAIEVDLKKASGKVFAAEQQYKKVEQDLVEIRIRFAALQEKESSLQEIILKQVQEKEHLQGLRINFIEQQAKLQKELQRLKTEENGIKTTLEKVQNALDQLEGQAEQQKSALMSCRLQKEELSIKLASEQKFLERYERRRQNLRIELIRLEEARKYLEENLREKFKFSPEEDIALPGETVVPEEDLIREKELLEEELSQLGEVNLGAVEEYARLQKRITFLNAQQEDLLQGEKELQKVLAELDEYMEKQFLQALQSIESNFLDIFSKLFGGGQAFLKLTDPANVLTAGVEIIAQPPGKKLQNISLLSGGEKALTAIALLFALLKHKPVPFCVLDEIESSLDDHNLAKFINFLRKYAGDTQFIVITHRRRTMEEVDFLYGITMEEQGVSKVVSLSLIEKVG